MNDNQNEDLLSITESTERDDNMLMQSGIFLSFFVFVFSLHKQSSDSIKTIDTNFNTFIKQNKEKKHDLK